MKHCALGLVFFENYQFSVSRRSANVMLYINRGSFTSIAFSNETVANIQKVQDIPEQEKENPVLSHDKTGLKAIRKEKISRFFHGLTCVRPWHGNNIYHPT